MRRISAGRDPVPYLTCHPNKGGRGCVGILLTATEDHVLDELWSEVNKPTFLDAIAAGDHEQQRDEIVAALQAVDAQRGELAAMWGTPGQLSTVEWQTARRALAEHEQQLRRDLAALPRPLAGVDVAAARSAWPAMTLDEQREFLRLFIEKVTVKRATPGTRTFDSGRVEITWRVLR
jgi:site-specific DNA recombinase